MPESVARRRLTAIAKNVTSCSAQVKITVVDRTSHFDILLPSIQATTYAACVINQSDLKKDTCLKEFLALKDCVQKAVRSFIDVDYLQALVSFRLGFEEWLNTCCIYCFARRW